MFDFKRPSLQWVALMQYSAKRNSDGTELTFTRPLKDGRARGFTYLLISVWKMFVFFCCFITIPSLADVFPDTSMEASSQAQSPRRLFTDFTESFETNQYILTTPENSRVLVVEELLREELFWKSQTLVLLVQVNKECLPCCVN